MNKEEAKKRKGNKKSFIDRLREAGHWDEDDRIHLENNDWFEEQSSKRRETKKEGK